MLRAVLATILLGTAFAKLASGGAARAALRSYGLTSARARAVGWSLLIALEAGLGVALATGAPGAAEAAAGTLAFFAAMLVLVVLRGGSGQPCGCFGGRSRIGWTGAGRAALLAAACASLPFVASTRFATQTWLAIGLVATLCGLAVLGVAIVALAREVGELRLSLGPQAALSLEGEGPELGRTVSLPRLDADRPQALAVFTSANCPLCHAIRPALRLLARDSDLQVEEFDEQNDAEAWDVLDIPGSPYGVVLEQGRVIAKGTFNTLLQLESLLAARA